MFRRCWLAMAVDVHSGFKHSTVVNGCVGDPIGRLQRDVARGLGYAHPEDIQLRVLPPEYKLHPTDPAERWALAVAPTADVIKRSGDAGTVKVLVKPSSTAALARSGASSGGGTQPSALPPPQRVTALAPHGYHLQAAFSHSAADLAADLRESIANAGRFCTSDGLELRIVSGALPPLPHGMDRRQPPHVIRDVWARGTPVFPDRMPSPGQAVVVGLVDVPDLPPAMRCGMCLWCTSKRRAAPAAASAAPVPAPATMTSDAVVPADTPDGDGRSGSSDGGGGSALLGGSLAAAARAAVRRLLGWSGCGSSVGGGGATDAAATADDGQRARSDSGRGKAKAACTRGAGEVRRAPERLCATALRWGC